MAIFAHLPRPVPVPAKAPRWLAPVISALVRFERCGRLAANGVRNMFYTTAHYTACA